MHRNKVESWKNVHLVAVLAGEGPLDNAIFVFIIHLRKLDIIVWVTSEREEILKVLTVTTSEDFLH